MFRKILVANRGEIALRVIRACRELDVPSVAVYSDADRDGAHVGAADEAYRVGAPPASQSYLNAERIFEIAKSAGCDALHPGYGFFAENAEFARRTEREGLTFIGPSPAALERMGGKIEARRAAQAAKVPVVPGTDDAVASSADALRLAKKIGFPIALKASAGGGGKGLKIASNEGEVERAFGLASREAAAYFRDGTLYIERYLARPKHVEVQVLGDPSGRVVHFGERDCSLQRRHQKLVEETPACIDGALRRRLHSAAVKLAKSIRYDSAGTIEFLVEGENFYFLEMNARIQVEHTITEATWGVDLVKAQIRIAAGESLWIAQSDLSPRGHSIECRINAESPADEFRPSSGRITKYVAPSGPGIRVDAAAYTGWTIPQEYDSLIGKVIAWGENRDEARRRMLRALRELIVEGVDTTISLLRDLLSDDLFASGGYSTPDLEAFARTRLRQRLAPARRSDGPAEAPRALTVEINDKRFEVKVYGLGGTPGASTPTAPVRGQKFAPAKKVSIDGHSVTAPMHGIIADVKVAQGDEVHDGQVIAVIEAMKMMNEVVSHRSGKVETVNVASGDTVETGSPIVTFSS